MGDFDQPAILPENSVVMPLTSSWCAWCEVDRSNGDLRNLNSRMKRKPRKIGSSLSGLAGWRRRRRLEAAGRQVLPTAAMSSIVRGGHLQQFAFGADEAVGRTPL
jgi:hypothetical protein